MIKYLIIIGSFVVAVGFASMAMDKLHLGRLPGDFVIKRRKGRRPIYLPLASTMLLSFTLSFLYWLSSR